MNDNGNNGNNGGGAAKKQAVAIDFQSIVARYKRYWWLLLLSMAGCLGCAWLYLQIKNPVYLVVSTVMVNQEESSGGAGASLIKSLSLGGGGSRVDDEVVVMGSQELCCKMIGQLGLNRRYVERKSFLEREDRYGDTPIEVDAPTELFDTLATSMVFKIKVDASGKADIMVKKGMWKTLADVKGTTLPATVKTPYGMFAVRTTHNYVPHKPYNITATVAGNIPAAEELMRHMAVRVLSKKSNAIYMDVTDTNVARGRDILNTIISLYNERGQREKDEQAVNTGKFIEERLGLIYKDLTGSEAEIEAYKRAHNMIDVGLQTKSLIGKQEVADKAIVALETKYRIASMIKDFVSDPSNRHSYIPFSSDSTAATASIKAYNQLVSERMNLSASATDDNQAMQQLDAQIETMRANVVRGVNNTLAALKIQIAGATAQSSESGAEMSSFPTQERETRALYRQQGIQNTLYTFLLQKREENALLLAAHTPKGKVVDHAYAKSEPVAPKKGMVAFLALIASLLLPMVLLYIKNLFYTKFSTEAELEDIAQMPVIGHVHHNRHKEVLVVKEGSTRVIVELFRYVRNNIQFMLTGEHDKVVLITSSVSGEGKSFVSLNVAAAFALLGKRVALVGMDIRKPRLAAMLKELKEMPGVTAYLSQASMTVADIAQPLDAVKGLDVLVGGAVPPNPSELLLGNRTEQLFAELREQYDIIVVDSAPVAMVSDTFSVAKWADMTVLVTRANKTKRAQVKLLNRLVAEGRLNNAGVLINDTKPSADNGYGYGYGEKK
ncbi:MAG: polysaccharide biosynthesis tyrosine autokinase [Muribaculaceae bacterium]|nr:polysaccharide biosynthesis tyrosine autokinase [Muribaculaceae bacterium]